MVEAETHSTFTAYAGMDSGSASGFVRRRSAMGDAASNLFTFRRPPGMTEPRVIQGIGCHAVTSVNIKDDPNWIDNIGHDFCMLT